MRSQYFTGKIYWVRYASGLTPTHKQLVTFRKWSKIDRCHSLTVPLQSTGSVVHDITTEADLGMFSMFGRTEAPTKRGPHKRTGNFLQHSNMPEIIIRRRLFVAHWRHKVSSHCNWHTALLTYLHKMSMTTTLTVLVL